MVNTTRVVNGVNQIKSSDRAVHDWYRFVLSFPPHLVRQYLEDFNALPGQIVFDPLVSVQQLADQIEARRIELGKTSGFEKLYHRVIRLYFGGKLSHRSST